MIFAPKRTIDPADTRPYWLIGESKSNNFYLYLSALPFTFLVAFFIWYFVRMLMWL